MDSHGRDRMTNYECVKVSSEKGFSEKGFVEAEKMRRDSLVVNKKAVRYFPDQRDRLLCSMCENTNKRRYPVLPFMRFNPICNRFAVALSTLVKSFAIYLQSSEKFLIFHRNCIKYDNDERIILDEWKYNI